jgi:hypothetical protein
MKKTPPYPYSFLAASSHACITASVALVVVAGIMACSLLLLTAGIPSAPPAEDTASHHRALIAELQRMAGHLERANSRRLDDARFDGLEMRLAEVHAMLGVLAEAMAGSAAEAVAGGGDGTSLQLNSGDAGGGEDGAIVIVSVSEDSEADDAEIG